MLLQGSFFVLFPFPNPSVSPSVSQHGPASSHAADSAPRFGVAHCDLKCRFVQIQAYLRAGEMPALSSAPLPDPTHPPTAVAESQGLELKLRGSRRPPLPACHRASLTRLVFGSRSGFQESCQRPALVTRTVLTKTAAIIHHAAWPGFSSPPQSINREK